MKVPHDPEELLAVVNKKDEIIDKQPRKIIHEKGLVHRETALFIINNQKELLVQQRTDTKKYDSSAAGHFSYDDTYENAIVRETKEELGITITKQDIKKITKIYLESNNNNKRFVTLFILEKNIPLSSIHHDQAEVSNVQFMDKKQLETMMEKEPSLMTTALRTLLKTYFNLYF